MGEAGLSRGIGWKDGERLERERPGPRREGCNGILMGFDYSTRPDRKSSLPRGKSLHEENLRTSLHDPDS